MPWGEAGDTNVGDFAALDFRLTGCTRRVSKGRLPNTNQFLYIQGPHPCLWIYSCRPTSPATANAAADQPTHLAVGPAGAAAKTAAARPLPVAVGGDAAVSGDAIAQNLARSTSRWGEPPKNNQVEVRLKWIKE